MEDPGADLPAQLRRYVDAVNGSDSNDGLTPQTAWKSITKVQAALNSLPDGTHILFRRGQTWNSGLTVSGKHAKDGARIVIGAYGPLEDGPPKLAGTPTARAVVTVENSSYITVRDLETERILMARGAHDILVFNNVVHWMSFLKNGQPSSDAGIYVTSESHHIAIVENFIYDINANDAICIHDQNWGDPWRPVGRSIWVVDNVIIGANGMEEGIDFATGHGMTPAMDVKIINNYIRGAALSGVSKLTGAADRGIVVGHAGRYYWILGNIVSTAEREGIFVLTGEKLDPQAKNHDAYITSNIIFDTGYLGNKSALKIANSRAKVSHNTVVQAFPTAKSQSMAANIVNYSDGAGYQSRAEDVEFHHNLLLAATPFSTWFSAASMSAIRSMDYNWFGGDRDPIVNARPLDVWRASTGFDVNSGAGPVPGVELPPNTPFFQNPQNWKSPEFLRYFIPDPSWPGYTLPGGPAGAFDADGNRPGIAIEPHEGLFIDDDGDGINDNGGRGWAGPLIIQQRYPLQ